MNFDGNNPPPPLPPRPGQISNGIFDNNFGGTNLGGVGYGGYNQSFPMNSFGGGFGNMYNQGGIYGGGYGYGNFGGGGGYGVGNSPESNFVRIAEEQSRGAFQSIESVVNAVASVANMLSSTHNAVFSSFRAVIGVVEQFSLLKAQLGGFVFITLFKWLKWLWRTLLVHMGLKPKNYNSNDFIWDDINNQQQQQQTALDYLPGTNQRRGFNWAAAIFWMIALGGPYLIYKAVSKMVANVEESRKWATGDREHYSAKALYDFNASSPQELSFRTNDILRVAPKSEQPQLRGWLLARYIMDSLEDMREWPRTAVLKLFELVKPHPILYDSKHGNWTNTTEKGRLWTKIAKELDRHLSSKKCRDRFQYNKKKHVRQIRRQIARGDASNVNMDLIWLLDEDGDGEQEISTNDRATDGTKSDSTNDTESGIHSHESIEEAASASRQVPAGLTFIDDPIALETDSGDGEPPSKRRKLETEDECSLFGRLVEIDLRRLDSKKRAKARLDITAILSQICDEGDEIPPTTASPSTAVDPSPSSSKHIKKKRSGNSRTKTKTEDGDASSKSTKSSKMSKLKKLITKSVMKSPKQKKDDKSTKSKKEKSKRG